ncbi:MAG TPA: glycoside hydrolase family 130 protein [Pseudonocardia sp.]
MTTSAVPNPTTTRHSVIRTDVVLRPDPARVLARLFVPGHELSRDGRSRASGLTARILALPEDEVATTLQRVLSRYAGRHRDFRATLRTNYDRIAHRVPPDVHPSEQRRDLMGACFTHEFSVEAAALFNPSVVAHPDQSGLAPGETRFVLSLRAVGEGHLSSVEFRTGVVGPGVALRVDDPGPYLEAGRPRPTSHDRGVFAAMLAEQDIDRESAAFVVGLLPARFDDTQMETALVALGRERLTRSGARRTEEESRRIVADSYEVEFPEESALAQRVLWPHGLSESRGIEDARFVRDEDESSYRATYTAFDGRSIAPQLIETDDFRVFRMSHLAGPAARNKGMALFPRKIGGRHIALSRCDGENNAICSSRDGLWWGDLRTLDTPDGPWALIQTGNCGSPVETEAGWIVLTHGVGPMREYTIGALLLDLDEPTHVLGALREPLLVPADDERDGYVPNVVYSCGALRLGERLLLPYGVSDSAVRFAFIDLPLLVERLTADGPPAAIRANSSA